LPQEIIYKRAETIGELNQILELQYANIPSVISKEEKQQEGFVTVHHSFENLKEMNDKCAHIIAVSKERVIGYALCMLKEFKKEIEVLQPMFKQIDSHLKKDEAYVVMGQICIYKRFRKQGIFRGLYQFMKDQLQSDYKVIVTEVDITNTRSINAHRAIGFNTLYSYCSNHENWEILYWNLKE
jgi:ribosomal protein S18 acetylase RimI-like enzyme